MSDLSRKFDAVTATGVNLLRAMKAYTDALHALADAARDATLTDEDRAALNHAPIAVAEMLKGTQMRAAADLCRAWAA